MHEYQPAASNEDANDAPKQELTQYPGIVHAHLSRQDMLLLPMVSRLKQMLVCQVKGIAAQVTVKHRLLICISSLLAASGIFNLTAVGTT